VKAVKLQEQTHVGDTESDPKRNMANMGSGISNKVLIYASLYGKKSSWLEDPGFIFPMLFTMSSPEGIKDRTYS